MDMNKFYSFEIVDKTSRVAMLSFAGLMLGAVLALAFYYVLTPSIGATVAFIGAYFIIFLMYVSLTNSKRQTTKLEFFKDKISFVFNKKDEISKSCDVFYKDIKQFKISPLTNKKNLSKDIPDINKYSLRIFGFQTKIELNDGNIIEFKDSYSDGVLMYSPSYVYRMLDIKRYIPDLPLVLENFNSKNDTENFAYQFQYYEQLGAQLPLFKNKKYILGLVRYTVLLAVVAALIGLSIAFILYADFKDSNIALSLLYLSLLITLGIILPMWFVAAITTFAGGRINKKAQRTIETIIKE